MGVDRIDPAAGCPNFFEKEGTFTYKRISIFDNAGEDILSFMASAIDFIERSKHYGAVLVHCKKVWCFSCVLCTGCDAICTVFVGCQQVGVICSGIPHEGERVHFGRGTCIFAR